jgi:hypothetical protein
VLAKGFILGCIGFLAGECVLKPVVQKVAGVVIPVMLSKLKTELGGKMAVEMKAKVDKMKARFGDGNPLSQSEQEARAIRGIERRLRRGKRAKYAQKVAGMGAMGAAAAVAGLV